MCKSDLLDVVKGVPQGSVLGPLLFTIYIDCVDDNIDKTSFHFYVDDTVIYCSAPTKQDIWVICRLFLISFKLDFIL